MESLRLRAEGLSETDETGWVLKHGGQRGLDQCAAPPFCSSTSELAVQCLSMWVNIQPSHAASQLYLEPN